MTPEVSEVAVIIFARNEEKRIGQCLRAVLDQEFAGNYEVLVIDSGSTDRTVDIASGFPVRLCTISPAEFHHGRTRHLGIFETASDLVVLLNGDATPTNRHWLSALVEAVRPECVAAAYSRQVPYRGAYPMEECFLRFVYPPDSGAGLKSAPFLTPFFSTVSCVLKRSVYECEPFSSTIVMSEDQEWSRRVVNRGYRVTYAPKSEVYHSHNYPLAQALRRFFDAGMTARISYLERNPGNWSSLARHALRYPLHELRFLVKRGHAAWIPYALVYEATKCLGFVLGLLFDVMPKWLVSRLSLNSSRGVASNQRSA